MINWLQGLGMPVTGDYAFITYLVGGCLIIAIVLLICSMLFGVATNIFRK